MAAIKFVGLYWLIPLSLLLTTSFFVLYALRKETSKGLQIFGKVVVVFLWLAAGIVLFTGVYTLVGDASLCYRGECNLGQGMMGRGMINGGMMGRGMMNGGMMGQGMMNKGMMKNPHAGMMKYHEYDEKGNIVLEGEMPANATQE